MGLIGIQVFNLGPGAGFCYGPLKKSFSRQRELGVGCLLNYCCFFPFITFPIAQCIFFHLFSHPELSSLVASHETMECSNAFFAHFLWYPDLCCLKSFLCPVKSNNRICPHPLCLSMHKLLRAGSVILKECIKLAVKYFIIVALVNKDNCNSSHRL